MCLKIYLALNGAFLLKFVLWGVFNFALNPERVTGENKSNIRIQNFKRNRMDFLCFFRIFISYGSGDIFILIEEGRTFGRFDEGGFQ